MSEVEIEWSKDYHDCETCGGSSSHGAVARVNGSTIFDRPAFAHCYNGTNVNSSEVYEAIFNHIGYKLTQTWVCREPEHLCEDEESEDA